MGVLYFFLYIDVHSVVTCRLFFFPFVYSIDCVTTRLEGTAEGMVLVQGIILLLFNICAGSFVVFKSVISSPQFYFTAVHISRCKSQQFYCKVKLRESVSCF